MGNQVKQQINIPNTKYHICLEIMCIILLGGIIIALVMAWPTLPDRVPTHYTFNGQADAWGSKGTILIIPITCVLLYVGMSVIEKFPNVWNTGVRITDKNRQAVYLQLKNLLVTLKLSLVLTFAYITFAEIYFKSIGSLFLPIMFILTFGPIVYFMTKVIKISKEMR